jgi:hypothetical protein
MSPGGGVVKVKLTDPNTTTNTTAVLDIFDTFENFVTGCLSNFEKLRKTELAALIQISLTRISAVDSTWQC